MTLMERLVGAGYPMEEMGHHRSDLYVYVTPLTRRVINEWFEEKGFNRDSFVSTFTDQVSGKPMYDVAFQYTPYWNAVAERKEEQKDGVSEEDS